MSKLIFDCVFGSKLYGTDTPQSDTDYKGVFLPTSRQIIMGTKEVFHKDTGTKGMANTVDDVDREYFSLKKFIQMASKGETAAIDMLHAPDDKVLINSEIFQFLRDNRSKFYTTKMKAYLGYVRKQASKYGVKGSRLQELMSVLTFIENNPDTKGLRLSAYTHMLPTNTNLIKGSFVDLDSGKEVHYYEVLGRKYLFGIRYSEFIDQIMKIKAEYGARAEKASQGVDWKAMSHAIRGAEQLLEIYTTGDLKFPLKNAEYIRDVKMGKFDFSTEVQPYLEHIMDSAESAAEIASKNGMPDEVDNEYWNDFIYEYYANEVIRNG
ncbi:thioredoxin [Aeromonas phage 65.2]|uniref:Thioredoxin n=1 Tax=Aeromonas phage 65.2 TaxID=1932896 RepID=A0A219YCS9_9CAUD|nr:thioredoxin [Aeromonas phage 65.2]